MLRLINGVVAASVLFWLTASPGSADQPGATIAGSVVHAASGQVLPGVRVTRWLIGTDDLTQYETFTGARGEFTFTDVAAGRWRVVAESPGFHAGAPGRTRPGGGDRLVSIGDGTTHVAGLRILLFPSDTVVAGIVRQTSGEPVVDAEVVLLRRLLTLPTGDDILSRLPYTDRTDDRGRYRIRGISGRFVVAVVPPPVLAVPAELGSDDGGRTSQALPGAWSVPPTPWFFADRFVVKPGDVHFTGLAPRLAIANGVAQVYRLALAPAGGRPEGRVHVDYGEVRDPVDIQVELADSHVVRGHVAGPPEVVGGLGMRLQPRGVRVDIARGLTAADGSFELHGVPSGEYELSSLESRGGTWWVRQPVSVRSSVDDLTLHVRRGAAFSGRIEFDGTPRPQPALVERIGVRVHMIDDVAVTHPFARADAVGRFTTGEYLPGAYIVEPVSPPPGWVVASVRHGQANISLEPIHLGDTPIDGIVITLSNRTGTVAGRVEGSHALETAAPAVYLFPERFAEVNGQGVRLTHFRTVSAATAGTFTIPHVAPGTYFIVSTAPLPAWTSIETLADLRKVATRLTVQAGDHQVIQVAMRSLQ